MTDPLSRNLTDDKEFRHKHRAKYIRDMDTARDWINQHKDELQEIEAPSGLSLYDELLGFTKLLQELTPHLDALGHREVSMYWAGILGFVLPMFVDDEDE